MIVIAHRGNTHGPDRINENRQSYLEAAINNGFNVEVDVWFVEGEGFMLGHDAPMYAIDRSFLTEDTVWCHAKNAEALSNLLMIGAHCFWHQSDDRTLTSNGWIWTYPGKEIVNPTRSVTIALSPADVKKLDVSCEAVCTDYAWMLKEIVRK
jgi:hypothetical protein